MQDSFRPQKSRVTANTGLANTGETGQRLFFYVKTSPTSGRSGAFQTIPGETGNGRNVDHPTPCEETPGHSRSTHPAYIRCLDRWSSSVWRRCCRLACHRRRRCSKRTQRCSRSNHPCKFLMGVAVNKKQEVSPKPRRGFTTPPRHTHTHSHTHTQIILRKTRTIFRSFLQVLPSPSPSQIK